ncbi:uncharacterized protein LOC107816308 [Nicotiana tabacum]|uniref:Uncharacterized protein LOC107816308 n=1 Tax=Nicotiana tabacum TaxID=4097 RepID=A0AC58UPD2_TOBAC
MDRFVTRTNIGQSSSSSTNSSIASAIAPKIQRDIFLSDLDLESLNVDPGDRKTIIEYNPNIPDKGQHSKWLEYSISKDAAYCLCCYLFKNEHESHGNTGDAFTKNGFKAWNKAIERFKAHVGEKEKSESRRRLSASIDVARFLLRLGLPFRGHDESQSSTNRGIFLELLQWYGDINRDVGSIILENAPRNEMMCSLSIQKDIVDACSKETIKAIIEDMNGNFFGILVDESKDISHKEQMALVLRYVNKEGEVIERFVGIVPVSNTSAMSLKRAICSFLSDHSLSPTQIRGQGYDGASNMQGELNVTNVLNIVGESFKRSDLLREHQAEKLEELLKSGEVHTERGLNQECGLQRLGDTRWGSHYKTLDNLIVLFPLIIHVLEFTTRECPNYADKIVAERLMGKIKEFDFAFMLHLMLNFNNDK